MEKQLQTPRKIQQSRRSRLGWLSVAAWLGLGVAGPLAFAAPLAPGTCDSWGAGSQTGTVVDEKLDEASGLVSSQLNPGLLWSHNDSGNAGDVFALTPEGDVVESFAVANASNIDWEDLALGPCPESCSCLFIADTGDNLAIRARKTIYRVPEPLLGVDSGSTQDAQALEFTYPDDAHYDSETLLVDPRQGELFVVTKDYESPLAKVFRFPSSDPADNPIELVYVTSISMQGKSGSNTLATGGDVAPDASRVVIRTLTHALEYTVPAGSPLESAFGTAPTLIELPSSSQGEAIAYGADGLSLLTISENLPAPVHTIPCVAGTASVPVAAVSEVCESSGGCSHTSGGSPARGLLGWLGLSVGLMVLKRLTRRYTSISECAIL